MGEQTSNDVDDDDDGDSNIYWENRRKYERHVDRNLSVVVSESNF